MENTYTDAPQKAFLAGVCLPDTHRFEERMKELEGLAEACGLEVVGTAVQNLRRADSAFYFGPGKVEELKNAADTLHADLLIVNNTLSPSQLTNLSKAVDLEVIDRTNLILNIFAQRARTAEAKMQVDYAKLKYMLPRLVGLREGLSRQGGTGGSSLSNRGAGEQKIELDRRHIERRMTQLRRRLAELDKTRETQRSRRARAGLPLVAMAGYTNAGKSTLMNRLLDMCGGGLSDETAGSGTAEDTSKHVYVEDMLFATLDTSVRRIEPEGRRAFLLSDTVGFIDDLPTALVDAFRSTLDEALHADLILHIVDASDPECDAQMDVTEQTLADLGAGDIPVLTVMNKSDLAYPDGFPTAREDRIFLSAKTGRGLSELLDLIDRKLNAGSVTCDFLIPYSDSGAENALRRDGIVHACAYGEDGITVNATIEQAYLTKYEKYRK